MDLISDLFSSDCRTICSPLDKLSANFSVASLLTAIFQGRQKIASMTIRRSRGNFPAAACVAKKAIHLHASELPPILITSVFNDGGSVLVTHDQPSTDSNSWRHDGLRVNHQTVASLLPAHLFRAGLLKLLRYRFDVVGFSKRLPAPSHKLLISEEQVRVGKILDVSGKFRVLIQCSHESPSNGEAVGTQDPMVKQRLGN